MSDVRTFAVDVGGTVRYNHGMIANFSRALQEGLQVSQREGEFDAALRRAIDAIYEASTVKV